MPLILIGKRLHKLLSPFPPAFGCTDYRSGFYSQSLTSCLQLPAVEAQVFRRLLAIGLARYSMVTPPTGQVTWSISSALASHWTGSLRCTWPDKWQRRLCYPLCLHYLCCSLDIWVASCCCLFGHWSVLASSAPSFSEILSAPKTRKEKQHTGNNQVLLRVLGKTSTILMSLRSIGKASTPPLLLQIISVIT